MFATELQRARVCRVILGAIGQASLWTDAGPTETAIDYLEKGSPLSGGEQVVFHFVWEIWDPGSSKLKTGDLIYRVDGQRKKLIGSFILATVEGARGIEDWLFENEAA